MNKINNNKLKGNFKIFRVFTIIGVIILFSLVLQLYLNYLTPQKRCSANLEKLGRAMMIYAGDYDEKFPEADKWCDLLFEGWGVTERNFRCPANKKERCGYAVNPNASKSCHSSVVLMFETKSGWNQYGGPELLTSENHGGKGYNILFCDLHVEFVKFEQFDKLNWKDEDVDPNQRSSYRQRKKRLSAP